MNDGHADQVSHAHNGTCPVCDRENISSQGTSGSGSHIHRHMLCFACNATWSDVYERTGYTNLVAPDE